MTKKSAIGKLAFFSTFAGFFSGITALLIYAIGNPDFFQQKGTVAITLAVTTAISISCAFMFKSSLDTVREQYL